MRKPDILASEEAVIRIKPAGDESIKETVIKPIYPSTCEENCRRLGRGHYHLIECKGGNDCGERRNYLGTVRHSYRVFHPHVDRRYDMYLCAEYWNTLNFAIPYSLE